MTRHDIRLAWRAKRAGGRYCWTTIRLARKHGVPPGWAFALVHQEVGKPARNVFGHDRGSILHGLPVTRARVQLLLRHVRAGGISNGVGFTQLTSLSYIELAERRGGAHRIAVQLDVGLEVFRAKTGGDWDQAWRYNGSPAYQRAIAMKRDYWHQVLYG